MSAPFAPQRETGAAGGDLTGRALILLRKFEQWRARVENDTSDLDYLNGEAWSDCADLAGQARALLAWLKVPSDV